MWKGLSDGSIEEGGVEGFEVERGRRERGVGSVGEGGRSSEGGMQCERIRNRKGVEEVRHWAVNKDSMSNEEQNWSNQPRGKVERAFVRKGEEEGKNDGERELCWERASRRALGWERRREMGAFEIESIDNDCERGAGRSRRWPAFLSKEKAQLAAEFRRLGIGACLAGTRGRQDCTTLLFLFTFHSSARVVRPYITYFGQS